MEDAGRVTGRRYKPTDVIAGVRIASRGRRKTRLRETHKIITYATLTRKAAANYSLPFLATIPGGGEFRRDFNAIPSDVCVALEKKRRGESWNKVFRNDSSERRGVLSPGNRGRDSFTDAEKCDEGVGEAEITSRRGIDLS